MLWLIVQEWKTFCRPLGNVTNLQREDSAIQLRSLELMVYTFNQQGELLSNPFDNNELHILELSGSWAIPSSESSEKFGACF